MASNSRSRTTSGWMFKDLGQLNIIYGEYPMDLKKFMALLKVRIDQPELNNINVPEKHQSLLNYTTAYWKLSFDFDVRRSGGKRKTEQFMDEQKGTITEGIEEANAFIDKLRNDELPVFSELKTSNDFESLGMLYRWKSNLLDFMTFYLDILKRWDYPSQREGKFTYLFMLFSKICLLCPEPGETYQETLSINGTTVSGIPDVRFIAHHDLKVVAVTEVKKEDNFKIREFESDDGMLDPFIKRKVPENILGQLAGELLLEKEKSFFTSGVVGVLCIGTKVFITFLEIEADHYSHILETGKAKADHEAKIHYTIPLDYMKADERNKLLEVLFWFAELQQSIREPENSTSDSD